jgi:hypothetical protein
MPLPSLGAGFVYKVGDDVVEEELAAAKASEVVNGSETGSFSSVSSSDSAGSTGPNEAFSERRMVKPMSRLPGQIPLPPAPTQPTKQAHGNGYFYFATPHLRASTPQYGSGYKAPNTTFALDLNASGQCSSVRKRKADSEIDIESGRTPKRIMLFVGQDAGFQTRIRLAREEAMTPNKKLRKLELAENFTKQQAKAHLKAERKRLGRDLKLRAFLRSKGCFTESELSSADFLEKKRHVAPISRDNGGANLHADGSEVAFRANVHHQQMQAHWEGKMAFREDELRTVRQCQAHDQYVVNMLRQGDIKYEKLRNEQNETRSREFDAAEARKAQSRREEKEEQLRQGAREVAEEARLRREAYELTTRKADTGHERFAKAFWFQVHTGGMMGEKFELIEASIGKGGKVYKIDWP